MSGPTMNTTMAIKSTSRMTTYMTQRSANVSHHRCGEEWRQLFVDVYRKICARRNHTTVNVDNKKVILRKGVSDAD